MSAILPRPIDFDTTKQLVIETIRHRIKGANNHISFEWILEKWSYYSPIYAFLL